METYIVRQPIVDRNEDVYGYDILYNENQVNGNLVRTDASVAGTIENFLLQVNSDKFLEGKTAFLTFTPTLILKNVPKIFSPQKLIIQIEDATVVHPLAMQILRRFKKQGYRIAVRGFDFSSRYFSLLEILDILKLDFSDIHNESLPNIVNISQSFNKQIIAYNVNNQESYEYAVGMGVDYIEGSYLGSSQSAPVHNMNYIQSNFFQLMVAVTRDEPNVEEIETLISRDVSLTFSLLRLVNSAYFALRNRVKSVQQALVILGLGQLKHWIYLLSFKPDSDDVPLQLIKSSFMRATFCSTLLEYAQDMPIARSEAYLMGMFSTLDALMHVPLEVALDGLSLSDEIRNALIKKEGRCGALYDLVLSYEIADWKNMTACAQTLGIPMHIITQKYFECVEEVNNTWNSLMTSGQPEPAAEAPEKSDAEEA